MAPGPGAHGLKLLLLEAPPGSLVAVLAEPSLILTLAVFRNGANDVLTHPLDKKTLLDVWNRISDRLPQGEQKTMDPQPALAKENMQLMVRLQEKNRAAELAHAALVKSHEDRTRLVCYLSHGLKTSLTLILGFADLQPGAICGTRAC